MQAAASHTLTPLIRPRKQISKHMQYVFNPVEHFISQQTQITLRDIHILWQGGGHKGIEFSFFNVVFSSLQVAQRALHPGYSLPVCAFRNFYTEAPLGSKSYNMKQFYPM